MFADWKTKKESQAGFFLFCLLGSGSFCLFASSLESLESTSGNANCRRLSVDYHMNFLKVDVPSAASCAQGV